MRGRGGVGVYMCVCWGGGGVRGRYFLIETSRHLHFTLRLIL